jgi:transposase
MSKEMWKDRETLEYLYRDRGYSQIEIARKLGCSDSTVSNWIRRFGLSKNRDKPWRDAEKLRELYHDYGMSTIDIGAELGCHHMTVISWMEKHDIERRDRLMAANKGRWKKPAPFMTTERGYECWKPKVLGETQYVSVHRLLAVSEYGFEAVDEMAVHHKNKIPWDNRPENIELLTFSEHMEKHLRDRGVIKSGETDQVSISEAIDA